ncbi:MAG: hypothetical protein EA381_05715 [Planctomycetaceae bacterium]|nr:MAG: hypothetical protein EA381_05715 [Planctomycetaceae bacterium]
MWAAASSSRNLGMTVKVSGTQPPMQFREASRPREVRDRPVAMLTRRNRSAGTVCRICSTGSVATFGEAKF